MAISKRVSLSYEEKYAVLKWIDGKEARGVNVSRADVIEFIIKKHNNKVGKATITKMRQEKDKIFNYVEGSNSPLKKKRKMRSSSVEDLNIAVIKWMNRQEDAQSFLSDELIKSNAEKLVERLGIELPATFNYSSSWVARLKKRAGFGAKEMHGEAADADSDGVKAAREGIPKLLSELDLKLDDIYNLDETGLLYRKLPTRTIMCNRRKGKKLAKDRLTVNVIVNATGNDCFLQVIGKSKCPRDFPGRTWNSFGALQIHYFNNKTAWMKSDVFAQIMRWFNATMKKKGEGKKLLLMDNFSGHAAPAEATEKTFVNGQFKGFEMSHVIVIFLPPNTTSIIQPLNQGIIAALKMHWRRLQLEYYVSEIDLGKQVKDVKVGVYKSLLWLKDAKSRIMGETISNCWRKSGILGVINDAEIRNMEDRKAQKSASKYKKDFDVLSSLFDQLKLGDAEKLDTTFQNESVSDFMADLENDQEDAAIDAVVESIEQQQNTTEENFEIDNIDDDDEEEESRPLPSLAKVREAADDVHRFIVAHYDLEALQEVEKPAFDVLCALRKLRVASVAKQKSIKDFLA